ncbi:MAG: ornithine cyclodeaminase family protein [Nitrososphaerota archaeon]|nr:ornithine cyclodeaminase family protein [Nitrososphaerota archaeon]
MKTLILGHDQVKQLLTMKDCIEAIEAMFMTLAAGKAVLPLRQVMFDPEKKGALASMPSYLGEPKAFGAKVITYFMGNMNTKFDSHQGAVLLFETENGRLLGIMDASSITAIRTAAASGVATRLLARRNSKTLAILGSGTEATTHLEVMLAVREVERVLVWSKTPDHARKFVERNTTSFPRVELKVAESIRQAVSNADIICTTTGAVEPILAGEWIKQGAHINAVGSSLPTARELDSAAVLKSRLFVDRKESALREAGDFLIPKKEGLIDDSHIKGEIGEVLTGRVIGRREESDVTLFKSLGIATEDVAAAHLLYTKALSQGSGTWVEFSSERET